MRRRDRQSRVRGVVAGSIVIGLFAVGAGLAAGWSAFAAIGLILAPVAAYLVFVRPLLGVAIVVASIPLELVVVFQGGVTLTRVIAIAVGVGWLARKLVKGERLYPLFSLDYSKAATLFITLVLVSALWALYPRRVIGGTIQLLQLFLLSLILVDVARDLDAVRVLVRTMVASAMGAASLAAVASLGGVRRAGGDVVGINGTAELLVVVTPLAFFLLWTERSRAWRIIGMLYPAFAFAGVATTLSRMGFLLLPATVGLLTVDSFINVRRGRGPLLVAAAAALIAGVTLVPADRVIERASTIAPYVEGLAGADPAGGEMSGRGYHLRIGVEVFQDHPLRGVGYDHYGWYFLRRYQHTVRGSGGLYTSWRSPHSSHVGMLADLGAIGTTLWLVFLFIPFYGVMRASRRLRLMRSAEGWLYARVVVYSFILEMGLFGFYSPNQREKLFWFVMALAVIADRLTRQLAGEKWGKQRVGDGNSSRQIRLLAARP